MESVEKNLETKRAGVRCVSSFWSAAHAFPSFAADVAEIFSSCHASVQLQTLMFPRKATVSVELSLSCSSCYPVHLYIYIICSIMNPFLNNYSVYSCLFIFENNSSYCTPVLLRHSVKAPLFCLYHPLYGWCLIVSRSITFCWGY